MRTETDPHSLVRDLSAEPRRRPDRTTRPDTRYGCTCGLALPGTSRRQARRYHAAHRRDVRQTRHVHDWLKPGAATDKPCSCGAVVPDPPF